MKTILSSLLMVLIICTIGYPQSGNKQHHANMPLDCQECHICTKPTYEKPCLKLLPDFTREGITVLNSAADAPEIIKIDTLKENYEPTIFTHKLHAEMAFMSGGCILCHHYNPPGKILSCIDCHEPTSNRTDLRKPGLKGAYHRQCLNCHREWSHTTNCTVCHAMKGAESASKTVENKNEYISKIHPEIKTPTNLVYKVDFEDGPIVTFYHNDHTDLFGLKCETCHQHEACGRCHDTMKKKNAVEKDPHENCMDCHESAVEENCQKCHDTKEKPAFNHANVGWSLNRYHKDLFCQDCHGHQGKFKKKDKQCSTCHQTWSVGNFDHSLTGIVLDEVHSENDCESCHINRNFEKQPKCNECHEEITYPEKIPGRKILGVM